jgi:hypothetical protein
MRYFQIQALVYEQTRMSIDAKRALPEPMTIYAPLSDAPKSPNGDALIAVREEHAAKPEYASVITGLITSGKCIELTSDQWLAVMPKSIPLTPMKQA